MLQSIKITGLFGRFNYELSFPCEGIMIITGPNGYGKSTILRIINNFCNNNIEKVLSYSFNKITIVCDNCSIQITKSKINLKSIIMSFHIQMKSGIEVVESLNTLGKLDITNILI